MEPYKNHSGLLTIIKLLFILLFGYTATSKLIHLGQFEEQLGRFPLIHSHASFIAWAVPTVELVVAGLYMIHRFFLMVLYGSLSLMIVFTGYILTVLLFGENIPCSCGGIVSSMGWKTHILFNSLWIALAVLGIVTLQKVKNGQLPKNTT